MHNPVPPPALALLLCLAATPGLAQTPRPAPATAPTAAPAAAPAGTPVPAARATPAAPRVWVRTGVHPDFGRVTFQLNAAASPAVQQVAEGVELRFHGPAALDLSTMRAIRQVAGLDLRQDGTDTVALLRLACDCVVATTGRSEGTFYVDIREAPKQRTAPPPAGTTAAPRAPPSEQDGLDKLRASLAAKLAIVNAPPGGSTAPGAGPARTPADPARKAKGDETAAVPAVPRPLCRPDFVLTAWIDGTPFPERLRTLRTGAARATEGAPEMAALAEFYVAYGLAAEALEAAAAWRAEDPLPAERARLERVADLAHLLRHETIDPASPLLAEPADCERADLPLWRAAAAAAAGDAAAVHRDAPRARALLRDVPDTLRLRLAMLIADGAPDDTEVLRVMSAAVRNAVATTPEDETGRLLLQARIARAENNTSDTLLFLGRAAVPGGGLPALQARAQLAALDAGREGPARLRGEAVLADLARTYRYVPLGQDAGAALAEARLRRGDYAGALAASDDSGLTAGRTGESRGAQLTARILRTLLVDPPAANLPPPAERLALYWRYEGYATPGERGDDIRLGAARTMLDQGLPEAALDVLHQVSPAALRPPEAASLRALGEARAATGDPQAALAILSALPPLPDARRAAATALDRLGRPADAASRLDTLDTLADRTLRAELLLRAADWPGATAAYAALMAEPSLTAEARNTAAERYALAAALGTTASAPLGIPTAMPAATAVPGASGPGASGLAADALAVVAIPPTGAGAPVGMLRDALKRAQRIEALMPPAPPSP